MCALPSSLNVVRLCVRVFVCSCVRSCLCLVGCMSYACLCVFAMAVSLRVCLFAFFSGA